MPWWWPFKKTEVPEDSAGPGRLRLGPGSLFRHYKVFVSSGDDLVDQRNMVKAIAEDAVNATFASKNLKIHLDAEMWETAPPRRLFGRETIDDEFVEKAKSSDLVVTLLWERVGGGTKKEVKAVLKTRTELALLWFVGRKDRPKTPAAKFLTKLMKKQKLRLKRAGRPGDPENVPAISQVLFDAALEATLRLEDARARL
jgi:hypothetical protein